MQKILVALVTVWAAVATCLWVAGMRKGHAAPQRPAPVAPPEATAVPAAAPAGDLAALQSEVARLRAEVTRLQAEKEKAALAKAEAPKAAVPSAAVEAPSNGFAQALSKFLTPEALRGFTRAAAAQNARSLYGPLMDRWGLSEDERAKMLALLEPASGVVAISPAMLTGAPAENAALKELLGENRYKEWQDYESSMASRRSVMEFAQRLQDRGMALSDTEREDLVSLFQKRGFTQSESLQFDMTAGDSPDQQAARAVDQGLDQWADLVRDAGKVLGPERIKELGGYLDERLERRQKMAELAGSIVKGIDIKGLTGGATGSVSTKVHVINSGVDLRSGAAANPQ